MSFLCSQSGASAAIVALDGSQLGDRQISVALSNPPSRKPRQPGADQQQRATEQPGRYAHVTVWESLLDSLNYNLFFKFVCRKRVTNIKPWFVCIACHSLYQRINWQECKLCEGIRVDEAALRGCLPKSVPLDLGLKNRFPSNFYHKYYYLSLLLKSNWNDPKVYFAPVLRIWLSVYRKWLKFGYFGSRRTGFQLSFKKTSHPHNLQIYTHLIAYYFFLPLLCHLDVFPIEIVWNWKW